MLLLTDLIRPENLHEIPRLRLGEIGEIPAQPQLRKEPRRARSVGVPAPPDALAIALMGDEQGGRGLRIQGESALPRELVERPAEETRYVAPEQKLGCAAAGSMRSPPKFSETARPSPWNAAAEAE